MILDENTYNTLQGFREVLIGIIEKNVRESGGMVELDDVQYPAISDDNTVVINHFRKIFLDNNSLIVQYDDDYFEDMQDRIELFTVDELLEIISGL